jgi:hypothetical protein
MVYLFIYNFFYIIIQFSGVALVVSCYFSELSTKHMNKGHSLLLCIIEQEKRGEKAGLGGGTKQGKCSVLCWSLCVCVFI